ncbi:ornithine cyclodeaminase [Rhizobiales bacterium GAS188]|nr:ornithine cyclodeaminase [Rhizobiales bacterium GAS188]
MSDTLVLTRAELGALVEPAAILQALRAGFIARSGLVGARERRFPVALPAAAPVGAGAMLLAPGFVPGIPAYSVKVHAKFPGSDPAIKGVIILHAIDDGRVLAILESTWLTALRTGFSGALGADVLARRDASTVAIIGAGQQGRLQLECLKSVRDLAAVRVFDLDADKAIAFARSEGQRLGLRIEASESLEQVLAQADIVLTSTWAKTPFLFPGMLRAGTHVTTLGPDEPGKAELSAELISASRFVADDRELALAMGAIGNVGLGEEAIAAELGEVLAGQKPGRTGSDEITVFGAVGLPFQDLAAAWLAYCEAERRGIGRRITLLD